MADRPWSRKEVADFVKGVTKGAVQPNQQVLGANKENTATPEPSDEEIVSKVFQQREAARPVRERRAIPDVAPMLEPVVEVKGQGIDHSGWDWESYPNGPEFNPPEHPGWLINKKKSK